MSASIGVSSCWRKSRFGATLVTYLIRRSWREKADGSSTRSLLPSFHVDRIIYTIFVVRPRACDQFRLLDFSPAMLQRYNRLRVCAVISRLGRSKHVLIGRF